MKELSILLPSIRPRMFKNCMNSIHLNTRDVDYEVIAAHDVGDLYDVINKSYAKASGKYVSLLCDDCEVHPGWARKMIDLLEKKPKLTMGTPVVFSNRAGVIRTERDIIYKDKPCSIFPFFRKCDVDDMFGFMFDYPRFKRFYGDIDLSLRFWGYGGSVEKCEDSEITVYFIRDQIKKDALNKYFKDDEDSYNSQWNARFLCAVGMGG
jgi:glycosyltransferase involved in cell wall biosynthesis